MSKLYEKYEELKNKNSEKIYIFESGNFYIALDSDAIILNEVFGFKLTKFSNLCDKCGFPKNSIEKYKNMFDNKNIKYEIVEPLQYSDEEILKRIKNILSSINIDEIDDKDAKKYLTSIYNLIWK